jgi:hypothetical protein
MRFAVPPLLLALGLSTVAGAQDAPRVTKIPAATRPTTADTAAARDARVGLKAGWKDAGVAARGVRLVGHADRPEGFYNPQNPGDPTFWNSDLAFQGNLVFQGSFHGLQVWDVSTPARPRLRASLPCPGGQGDVSILGNLLFMSVEETRGRVDCGAQGVADTVSAERFRGVRIFDVTDVAHPKQVAAIQTCRGSHTHTVVPDPKDSTQVYVYVSGTSVVRSPSELAGCSDKPPAEDPNTSLFRIDVIRVPLARPQDARIVAHPRIFADEAGNIAGLQKIDRSDTLHVLSETNRCHDITVYPAVGLAAGACAGDGILLDISDPASPRRVAEVSDPNFSFWHSATFNNDGTALLFTDEWGGGTQPRCRATDRPEWGANAIYSINGRSMTAAGYYKIPAPQTGVENCVAHNGTLIPVPGRDIMAQAWYQGGLSVFDFTDPSKPKEIAFFDRGPMNADTLQVAGYWAAYWYNGRLYGTEMGRGLDLLELTPGPNLSRDEIEAAKLVRTRELNPQTQLKLTWPASFHVARAYLDQLDRDARTPRAWSTRVRGALARAESAAGAARRTALTSLATQLDAERTVPDARRVTLLAGAVRDLAAAAR